MEETMADNRKRVKFKSIAILEAVIILFLIIGLVFVAFIKGRKDAVPANAQKGKSYKNERN